MRAFAFSILNSLPSKIFGGAVALVTLYATIHPAKLANWYDALDVREIQQYGFIGTIACLIYLILWLLLRPSLQVSDGTSGPIFNAPVHIHNYQSLNEKMEDLGIVELETSGSVQFSADIIEQADSFSATGVVTGLAGLYVGNIIVAAGALEKECRLDLAIICFNGTQQPIQVSDVSGCIRAGSGNLKDMQALEEPFLQGLAKAAPTSEFIISLRQHLTRDQAGAFLRSLDQGGNVGLDLRNFIITVVSARDSAQTAPLPLWDGVNLKRRDDVVSNRNVILSASLTSNSSVIAGLAATTRKSVSH